MSICVGVDIGGTKIGASAVRPDGSVLAQGRRETPARDPDQIVAAVADVVRELQQQARAEGEEVVAVGAACAGFIDRAGETVIFAPNPCSGRVTALCSKPVISTRSPGRIRLRMAMFSPWVQLEVNTTCSGAHSNISPALSRQR